MGVIGDTTRALELEDMPMAEIFKNLVAGEWVAGGRTSRNINPSNTGDIVGEYAQA